MATTVYLIRHGETEDADSRRYKGRIDVPLSENGVEQIKRLADYFFQNSELKAVYCSGLIRSVRSADIIAEPYGLKPVIVEGLKERNFGVWEGMSFDEIKEKWPDAFDAWAENPLKFSPMEGESTIEVRERALKAFDEIMKKHNGDSIAIVAHGGINRVILCELLGMPLENIFRIEQDFAALNVIELWDYPVVKHINYVV
ncbi:MAG TPA: alpha-ribazole phosphatase [Nitrospirae bacterium]|nr:alpha-ribazole phosphatase [Nitrospirota bacterium]HDZ00882.1 alpha-ribazole phosphatase [Nitrospirota bacterium]